MNKQKSKDLIKKHEGLRLEPYLCSAGVLTVGYGHTKEPVHTITQEQADQLLDDDFNEVLKDLSKYPFNEVYPHLDEVRQAVLENMMFNLGYARFSQFRRFLFALKYENYGLAAKEMLDSKWACQVKGRAVELARMMKSGKWQDED